MAIGFPATIDALTNPAGTDNLNSPDHAAQHATSNDIHEAMEAKVGVNSSAVTTSIDFKINHMNGENLIENASFESYNIDTNLPVMWTLRLTPTLVIATDTLSPSKGGKQVTITATGAGYEGIGIEGNTTNWCKVLPSTIYTFSFDHKETAGDNLWILINSYNGAVQGTLHYNETVTQSITATRVSYTFTTDADTDNLNIRLLAVADGDIIIVSHPKLEEGTIATPYSPPSRERSIVTTIANHATPTPVIACKNTKYFMTANAEAFAPGAPTGNKYDGDRLCFRFLDDGTGRAITWNAAYTAIVARPTTTTATKTMSVEYEYNVTSAKWECIRAFELA